MKRITYRYCYLPDHPLADSTGRLPVHRALLYARYGPGPHPCHWCGKVLEWLHKTRAGAIVTDHVDMDPENNDPGNIVISCNSCNTRRGRPNQLQPGEEFIETIGRLGLPTRNRVAHVRCLQCGQEFVTIAARLKHGRGLYCSRSCKSRAVALKRWATPSVSD